MADTPAASASGIPDASQLVDRLKASGQLERLRERAVERLKHDEALDRAVEAAVLESRAFKSWAVGDSTRQLSRELQNELRGELNRQTLRALWRILSEEGGTVSAQIDEAIRAELCHLHASQQEQGPS